MKNWAAGLLLLFTCLWPIEGYWASHLVARWGLVIAAILLAMIPEIRRHPRGPLFVLVGYFVFRALPVVTHEAYSSWHTFNQAQLAEVAAYGAGCACLLLIPIRVKLSAFAPIFVVSVFWTFMQLESLPYQRAAMSGNASMNGCLIALTLLPFLSSMAFVKRFRYRVPMLVIAVLLALKAIVMTETTVPLVVFGAVLSAWLFSGHWRIGLRWLCFAPIPICAAALIWVGAHGQGAVFWSSGQRVTVWSACLQWLWDTGTIWYGTGTGTGIIMVPWVQQQMHVFTDEHFIRMHNDWLQILFEAGLPGLVLALAAYADALRKAFNSPPVFAGLVGFGVCMCMNYPCHLPIHAALGGLLLITALRSPAEAA